MATLSEHLGATGETQEAFAKRIGSNQSTVSRICRGQRVPRSKELMRRIFEATGGEVTANDLFGLPSEDAA